MERRNQWTAKANLAGSSGNQSPAKARVKIDGTTLEVEPEMPNGNVILLGELT